MVSDAAGMIDAVCPKCKRRFGWSGPIVDAPPCPRCGHRIDPVTLKRDQAALNDTREILRELAELKAMTKPLPAAARWKAYRVCAGLTLGQAARLLGVTHTELSAIECGQCVPDEAMVKKLAELYGGQSDVHS